MADFSLDYFAARDRFRSAATCLGCAIESHAVESRGPAGEELTIDVARWGEARADRVVILSSGLHGVEGLFGSAVQTAWLEACTEGATSGAAALPRGTAVVLIHAVNPWGFAHLRRTDERNIDLNRNFLLPGERHAGSPTLYGKVDSILNPARPPQRLDLFGLRAAAALARYGRSAVTQAIAEGQYAFPRGLFFGGTGESEIARLLGAELPRCLGDASRVFHLDFHTGLGPWATYKLLADFRLTDEERRLTLAMGHDSLVIEPEETPSGYYRSRGGLGGWCRARFADRRYLLLVAEFGTYGPLKILSALRHENQAHHFCQTGDLDFKRAKARLCEVFCPASPAWRDACLGRGMGLIQSAVRAIG
jgi:predicted deacylase